MTHINFRTVQGWGYPDLAKQPVPGVPERTEQGKKIRSADGDRVSLSTAGRALAAARAESAPVAEGMGKERLTQIRTRIMQGAYDSLDVVEEVARRLLANGHV